MGELAGIISIIGTFALCVAIFLGFFIWYQYIKLNECLSIYVWAARYGIYTTMIDWQNVYNGKLTPKEILELKAWEWHHVRDKNGRYYSRRWLLQFLKRHNDSDHLSVFGIKNRADGKDIGSEKIRHDT